MTMAAEIAPEARARPSRGWGCGQRSNIRSTCSGCWVPAPVLAMVSGDSLFLDRCYTCVTGFEVFMRNEISRNLSPILARGHRGVSP